jgi:hypothetical protein
MNQPMPIPTKEGATPLFFPVSRRELVVLSICSFGIYELYWFYRNWVLVKQRRHEDIRPAGRAVLAIFFCYDLFDDVDHSARIRGVTETMRPGLLALAYIGLTISSRLPAPFWLLCIFGFLPLLRVQKVIDEINLRVAPHAEPNDRFSRENIAVIILGSSTLAWIVGTTIAPFVLG